LEKSLKIVVPALAGASLFLSCTPDMEVVNALTDQKNTPGVTAKNSEVLYTEGGQVKIKVIAPLTKYYQFADEPYSEFPEGITVYTFDEKKNVESSITAKFAIYYEKKELWLARNNVVGMNRKGEILNTEELYWDQKKKIIYTDVNIKITQPDGVLYGKGLISDETFDNWEIKKPYGGEISVEANE